MEKCDYLSTFATFKSPFWWFDARFTRLFAPHLALQLEELIADHVITKTVISLRPLKTEYQLSEFGQTLSPVINAMATWGTYYNQVAQQDVGYCNLQ